MLVVAAGVITRGREVLVCQRPSGGHYPFKWEFPGGKCEPGETPAQGLQRELREELGIEADVGRELWRTQHQYPRREAIELVFFLVNGFRGAVVNHAFAAMDWAALNALSTFDFLDGDREFIARLERGTICLQG